MSSGHLAPKLRLSGLLGSFLTEHRKTLEYKDNWLDYVSTQEGLQTLLC